MNIKNILLQPSWFERKTYYSFCERYGFGLEIISFVVCDIWNSSKLLSETVNAYKEELNCFNGYISLHGPHVDIIPHSLDNSIARIAMDKIRKTLKIALQLNCNSIIFHTGINPLAKYYDGYFEEVAKTQGKFWSSIATEFSNVEILLENVWEPTPDILSMILEYCNYPNFNIAFDVGHVNAFSNIPISTWIEKLYKHIKYMHWSDNHGNYDSHLSLGEGHIDWNELFYQMGNFNINVPVALELGELNCVKKSLKYLSSFGIHSLFDVLVD